jgi:hypothetical protein
LGPAIETNVGQRVDQGLEIDLALAQIIGIVFQMDLMAWLQQS